MKPSIKMQRIITEIAAKHGLDLSASEAHLRLEMPNFDRLVIEKIGAHRVSVAHYFEQQGDTIADPDMVFWIAPSDGHDYAKGGWYPIEIQQIMTYEHVVVLDDDDTAWVRCYLYAQGVLASFGDRWAHEIEAANWLELGQAARPARNAA